MTPFARITTISYQLRTQLYRKHDAIFRIAVSGHNGNQREHITWWQWHRTKRDLIKMLESLSISAPYDEDLEYVLWVTNPNVIHRDSLPHQDITQYIRLINLGK